MTSKISAIKTQILADIVTTSIDKAYEGPVASTPTTYPWAEVVFGGGSMGEYITQEVDRDYQMVIRVHGTSTEQVEVALEEIAVLWNTGTELAAIIAAGVVTIYPTSHYPPFVFSGSTQMPVYGDIEFTFRVQFT